MRRKITCPLCETELTVPLDAPVGGRAECASCGDTFRIPASMFDIQAALTSGTERDTVPDRGVDAITLS